MSVICVKSSVSDILSPGAALAIIFQNKSLKLSQMMGWNNFKMFWFNLSESLFIHLMHGIYIQSMSVACYFILIRRNLAVILRGEGWTNFWNFVSFHILLVCPFRYFFFCFLRFSSFCSCFYSLFFFSFFPSSTNWSNVWFFDYLMIFLHCFWLRDHFSIWVK